MVRVRRITLILVALLPLAGCGGAPPSRPTELPVRPATEAPPATEEAPVQPEPAVEPPAPSAPPPAAEPQEREPDAHRTISEVILPLEDSDSTVPDALVLARNHDRDRITVLYLRGDTRMVRWERDIPTERLSDVRLAVDGAIVVVVAGERLLAFDRADGREIWQAALSDTMLRECDGCLRLLERRIITLTQDGVLSGFEPGGGGLAWNVRLNGTPDQLLVLDGRLALLDLADPDAETSVLQIRGPADGELLATIVPDCPADATGSSTQPDLLARLTPDPDGRSLLLTNGGEHACILRIDTEAGEQVWGVALGAADAPASLPAGERVYVAAGKTLSAIASADGTATTLAKERDYLRTPLAFVDGVLIVEAIRTRGSRRVELWGLDPATGERIWSRVLPTRESLGEEGATWDLRPWSGGMLVLMLERDESRLIAITIDGHDGGGPENTFRLDDSSPYWRGVVWGERYLWVALDRLTVLDAERRALVYTWP